MTSVHRRGDGAAPGSSRTGRPPSRRGVLAALGLAGLAGCGSGAQGAAPTTGTPSSGSDVSDTDKVVSWSSRPAYLDLDPTTNTYRSLQTFQNETGIRPTYVVDLADNETFYRAAEPLLRAGRTIGRDLVVLSDWMTERMIRQGFVRRLEHANLPNLRHLRAGVRAVDYDQGRDHSLPWLSGFTGIAYNVAKVKEADVEVASVSDLWHPRLRNRVLVLSEMRDTMGLIMLEQGKDPATFTAADFAGALTVLQEQLRKGQIRSVAGNDYLELLASGDAVAAFARSGDIASLGPGYAFAIPTGGGLSWSDDVVVPIGASHQRNAEILINYYFDPAVMAKVVAVNPFVPPVDGVQQALTAVDPKPVDGPWRFPTPAQLRTVHAVRSLQPAEEASLGKDFDAVLGR